MYSDGEVFFEKEKTEVSGTVEGKYIVHVLDPEHTEAHRIPNPFPINTAITHGDRVDTLQTDANGNLLIRATYPDLITSLALGVTFTNDLSWNPVVDNDALLAVNSLNVSTLGFNNQAKYRLVAYKMKLRYIGAELNRAGVFFAAHDFTRNFADILTASSLRQLQDGPFFEMHPTNDGIEVIYKPYDNSYLEFSKNASAPQYNNTVAAPYTIVAGIIGGQASSTCVLCEQFITVEYIPEPALQDNVEVKQCPGSPDGVASVKGRDVVRKANELVSQGTGILDTISSAIGRIGQSGIGKMMKQGIVSAFLSTPLGGIGNVVKSIGGSHGMFGLM